VVDHVLRLKLALLGSAFRGVASAVRALLVLGLAGAVGTAVILLAQEVDVTRSDHRVALIVVASCLALAIVVAPLSAGLGSAMEPGRFARFPLPNGQLALGLMLAGALGVPGALAITLGIALELAWAGTDVAGVAILAGVLGAIAVVMASQYLVALTAQLAVSSAAVRLMTSIARLTILVALAASGTAVALVQRGEGVAGLGELAGVLANTPTGLLWAAPDGPGSDIAWRVFGGAVMVAIMVAAWPWVVRRLVEAPRRIRTARAIRGLGWFDLVPATPSGAIAARSLLYWTRDARYRAVIIALPLAPALMMLALATAGAPLPLLWLIPVPVVALFLGWFSHNDVAYDHTAVWVHVSSPVSGVSDRWGRAVPPLLLGLVLIAVASPFAAMWSEINDVYPAVIGTGVGLLLTGLGVSSVSSALRPYPAARPGAGPWDQPPLVGASAGWIQSLTLLATLAFMAPALTIAVMGLLEVDSAMLELAGWAGAATGFGIFVLGILVGGFLFRRRAPELLGLVMRT
jgi:ABC-2 type transport system permease protein